MIPHVIRPMRVADEGFVYDSWLRSLADECNVERGDAEAVKKFKRSMRPALERIITNKRTATLVACGRRDENQLFGWACGEAPGVLHFAYVGKDWRGHQIARALVAALKLAPESRATHYTSWGFPRIARMFADLQFDPTLLIAER